MPPSALDERMAAISRYAHATRPDAALIEPGVEIWTKEGGRRDEYGQPLGGIVVECFPGASGHDMDTGELIERPASYRCYNPFTTPDKAFLMLEEPEVNMDGIRVADRPVVVKVIRRMCAEVGKAKQARGTRTRGSGFFDSREMNMLRYAFALLKAVTGGTVATQPAFTPRKREEADSDEF